MKIFWKIWKIKNNCLKSCCEESTKAKLMFFIVLRFGKSVFVSVLFFLWVLLFMIELFWWDFFWGSIYWKRSPIVIMNSLINSWKQFRKSNILKGTRSLNDFPRSLEDFSLMKYIGELNLEAHEFLVCYCTEINLLEKYFDNFKTEFYNERKEIGWIKIKIRQTEPWC